MNNAKFEVIDPSGQIIARIPANRIHTNMIIKARGYMYQIHTVIKNAMLAEAIILPND